MGECHQDFETALAGDPFAWRSEQGALFDEIDDRGEGTARGLFMLEGGLCEGGGAVAAERCDKEVVGRRSGQHQPVTSPVEEVGCQDGEPSSVGAVAVESTLHGVARALYRPEFSAGAVEQHGHMSAPPVRSPAES